MLNNTQYLKYFLNILFSLLLCLSFFSNRVNGVSSRKGTFYSSLLHHNIYYISEWPKKSKEGKNSQKYTINITLILYQHCLQRDTRLVTKSGAGKRGWLFWKLLFVHLSFRARNQNQKMLKYFCGVLSSQGSLSAT